MSHDDETQADEEAMERAFKRTPGLNKVSFMMGFAAGLARQMLKQQVFKNVSPEGYFLGGPSDRVHGNN